MNRLYVVESTPTTTGAKADHRLPLRGSRIENFALVMAGSVHRFSGNPAVLAADEERFLNALSRDLGSSVVIAGDHLPPSVHAIVHRINEASGSIGKTVFYTDPVDESG
jgi:molybdopterin-containing oxidoreductase family iron-sulfur binding subunit